ncbi:MAG: hypothetical protein U0Z26_10145 [Anaerolineales bacterium]
MKIHPSRFEQMTAFTDLLLGLLSFYVMYQLIQFSGFKAEIWRWAFGLLGLSSFLGVAAHGFEMTQKTNDRIWMPLNLSLGITLGLFVVGALFDLSGETVAGKALPFMVAIGFVFFLITVLRPGSFMTFIAYEAIAMVFALIAYSYLFYTGKLLGSGWMLAGIFVTILAAAVQAMGKAGKSILWYFDNNGIFHVIQLLGIVLLLVGLKASL